MEAVRSPWRRVLGLATSRLGLLALLAVTAFLASLLLTGREDASKACQEALSRVPGRRLPDPSAYEDAERECPDE